MTETPTEAPAARIHSGDVILKVSRRKVTIPGRVEEFTVTRVRERNGSIVSYYVTDDGYQVQPVLGQTPWCVSGTHRSNLPFVGNLKRAVTVIENDRREHGGPKYR